MKILHIEDDPGIQVTVELLLKVVMPEADLYTAGSGVEGIDVVRYSEPDIILLDLGLPDITGYEVISQVREFSLVPIIVTTARREEEVKATCLQLGADDFIAKPFNHREIVKSLNNVFMNHPHRTDTADIRK